MADPSQLSKAVNVIQGMPEFKGCQIGFQGVYGAGGPVSRSLFDGLTPMVNYGKIIVIIEELHVSDPATIKDTRQWANAGSSPSGAANPVIVDNKSRLGPELVGAGLTCGLTVVAAVGVFGSAAAEVPSAGTSTFLLVVSWTGMVTAGIECANSLTRLGVISYDPKGDQLQQLDNNKIYSYSMLAVDALNVASGLASLPAGAKNLYAIIARQRGFAARGLTEASLRQMNQVQRAKVIGELVQEASKTPEGLEAIMQAAREAQVGAKSIQRGTLSVRNATKMTSVIADETMKRLSRSLLSVLSVPAGTGVSAMPSSAVGGAATGSVNFIVNLIDAAGGTSI